MTEMDVVLCDWVSCLRGLTGITLDHRSLPPEFESRRGYI